MIVHFYFIISIIRIQNPTEKLFSFIQFRFYLPLQVNTVHTQYEHTNILLFAIHFIHLTHSLGIIFGLEELWGISWQVVGVHEFLSRSFIGTLKWNKNKTRTCESVLQHHSGYHSEQIIEVLLLYFVVLCCSWPKPCSSGLLDW